MIINIIKNKNIKETKITIECNEEDNNINKIVSSINNISDTQKIIGKLNGETYCINQNDFLYFESVDRKTFGYTHDTIYEVPFKLYEIEERISDRLFFRISKSIIINLNRIKCIKPELNGKILATLDNDEKLYISRQYVSEFKKKIGIGGNN